MRIVGTVLSVALLLAVPLSSQARTWYVNDDRTGDVPTIQAAIDAAQPGDDVLVASGMYNEENQRRWRANSLVRMKSGIWLHSVSGPNATILDGRGLDTVVKCTDVDQTSTIEGFTIKGARKYHPTWGDEGGGIYCYRSSPNIAGNIITGNGGGIICTIHSSPIISNNVIAGNTAYSGGGIFCYYDSSPAVTDNVIRDNTADSGGGVYCQGGCAPDVFNNTFSANHASLGSGIFIGSIQLISRNIFSGHTGSAALHCSINNQPDISCNDFWENTGDGDGCPIGGNNVFADPLFCNPGLDDYSLCSFSPCAPGNPMGCGLIGAKGVGCICGTPQEVACTVSPVSMDFGLHRVGCSTDLGFKMRNDGALVLTGTVGETSEHYSILYGGGTYFLTPGESLSVKVRFEPMTAGRHDCVIETGNTVCSTVNCVGYGEEAGPGNGDGKWVLHFAGQHDSKANTCAFQIEDGEQVVVEGPSGPGRYDVYVVAVEVDRIAGTRCGLSCDGQFQFYGWTSCSDFEIPTAGWPGCGEGIAQTWVNEQQGPYVTVGVLDVYVYGIGLLRTATDPRVNAAEWCDGSAPQPICYQTADQDAFGSIGFGQAGYNPISEVSMQKTTWGAVKAMYR